MSLIIIVTKIKDIKNTKHVSKECPPPQPEAQPSSSSSTTTSKRSRHVTTNAEKQILTPYLKNPNPSSEDVEAVLNLFLEQSPDYWTKKKVLKAAWVYHVQKKDLIK